MILLTSVPPISVEEWPPVEAIHIGSIVLLLNEGDKLLTVNDLVPAREGNAGDWPRITPAFVLGFVGFTSNKKRPCSDEAVHRELLKTSSL